MIKRAALGLVVSFLFCAAISQGHAWGALLWEVIGAGWLCFCLSKYD